MDTRQPLLTTLSLMSLAAVITVSGCMTDATVELTKAPFDATTALTNGTTDATMEILEPLTEFTSSTTPGAWINGDPRARARQKTRLFAAYELENLRSDMAKGRGEYLASLADLAGVPEERRPLFFYYMRSQYAHLYEDGLPARESFRRVFHAAWTAPQHLP